MTKKKPKKPHAKKRIQKTRKVLQTRSKRRRRKPSPANSKTKNRNRKKPTRLVSKARKSVKRTPKRKRKGFKNPRLSNKVQKVSRGKKQLRRTKKVHKRTPAKQVRKVRKPIINLRKSSEKYLDTLLIARKKSKSKKNKAKLTKEIKRVRINRSLVKPKVKKKHGKAPQAYTTLRDDKGEKKLYRIELRQFKTFKEKRSYITRYNFWPMITEAENLFEDRFPFGFMVIIQTRFKAMELDMAGKLSDIEAAIDDPNMREAVLGEMDSFRTKQIEHPQLQNTQTRSDQLFKPNNIKAIIIRFLYRTFKNASS